MNLLKNLIYVCVLLLAIVGGARMLTAQSDNITPAVTLTARAATLPGAAQTITAGATLGQTLDSSRPVDGTVVIQSSVDEEDPYADEESTEDEAPQGPSFVLTKSATSGLITIDAPGEDIRKVIRQVADLYGLNIVIPETLNGSTTLKLREVGWKQLFEVMLPPAGYSYTEDRNIVLIKSREELSAEPTETRVFLINYATAPELSASIAPLIDPSAGGRIQVDRRANALVITERPSKFNNIKDIIERLDKATPQVMIESKFIEVTDKDSKNLGVDWKSLSSYQLSAGPFTRNWARGKVSGAYDSTISQSAVFSAPVFNVVLRSLTTLTGSNLISNPTVVTLNNTEATINIGEEYPIPEYSYNQQQGTFEVSGFTYKPIGINLKVTPQVNSQGYITLSIAPEVSSRTGEVTFGGASGASIPIISTRKTISTINIKDGYTLAIGGLIETTKGQTVAKIPLLGDIPLAGKAFRSNTDTVDRRNLMIFITARTVNPDGTGPQAADPRVLREMNITESDMPGYTPTAEEQELIDELQAKRETYKRLTQLEELRAQNAEYDAVDSTPKSRSRR